METRLYNIFKSKNATNAVEYLATFNLQIDISFVIFLRKVTNNICLESLHKSLKTCQKSFSYVHPCGESCSLKQNERIVVFWGLFLTNIKMSKSRIIYHCNYISLSYISKLL